jgi:ubiquinone/menaquinone biosynthesis C-methylase UbiE
MNGAVAPTNADEVFDAGAALANSEPVPGLVELSADLEALPACGLNEDLALIVGTRVLEAIWTALADQNVDPVPIIAASLSDGKAVVAASAHLAKHIVSGAERGDGGEGAALTKSLFETAWTSYDEVTYDHSIELMKARLLANGFDDDWFRGKTCFDGGCGTGRFSVAMAEMGARHVVAADIGADSLRFCEAQVKRRGVGNVETRTMDVSDLSSINDGSFDFVASHGVLHHTEAPVRGIIDHFRITKSGGVYWLYLYGKDGLIWHVFDQFRPVMRRIGPRRIRERLLTLGFRKGLVYSYIDNFLSPRVYFGRQQVIELLAGAGLGEFKSRSTRGPSTIDDPAQSLATKFGAKLYGPEGEVRLLIERL